MRSPPETDELDTPPRILMGPGPSTIDPRVLKAMSTQALGYMDPRFLDIMDDIQELLRYTFQTNNDWTLAISGTGTAAMEASIGNLVEPGEKVLVRTTAYWGDRVAQMTRRVGGEVVPLDVSGTDPLDPDDVAEAFAANDIDVFYICHADTTTGIRQPDMSELTDIAHEHDAYTIVDCVTSLSGVELHVDDWGIDVAYGSPQKCLSSTPGATPLTVNERAREKIQSRASDTDSWYLDLDLLMEYWGDERNYHHTAPVTPYYGLREALRLVAEEGLENRWERHREVAGELKAGIERIGLEMAAPEEYWLPSLNTVQVPDGVDDTAVIEFLMDEYDVEIASGLGELDGEIWRIGCMGYSARRQNVACLLTGLEEALEAQGYEVTEPSIEA
ncbi:pyridoxal-phosphate-dependent aminotransferase family protein [Haloplanus sp.]|uniref:pyridoxal-phosphate-dependent aminotransferase family protein n=1 Tax=Haloplanus sp. TaxID=1961696 RepID=UPI00262C1D4C|nr:alanine--glyoxylate aminotransferase family protein [Haloplanus sp.]